MHTAYVKIRMPGLMLFACMVPLGALPAATSGADVARGTVFEDRNRNGVRDAGEPPLAGVRVSNGRDIVLTAPDGRYELPIHDDTIVFVIKPRHYMTAINERNIPQFHYVHKPKGSPAHLKYAGVAPTGQLPDSIDFPLHRQDEPDRFEVIVLGDPQPYTIEQVDYLAHDIVAELIGSHAAFGVSLGDVVGDVLSLYDPYIDVVSMIGIPWHNVHGNHDENYDVKSDALADETWERVFGPPTYSFDWGPVHFIVVDDVMYDGAIEEGKYHPEFAHHLTFIENDLKHVPKEQLVVLMMHIPVIEAEDKGKLFALLTDHPHTFSMSAHWHMQQHCFLGPGDEWHGRQPHHHLIHATSCGSWWQGAPDEFGIPHTMMRDGAPNGYSIVTFDGHRYSVRFKAARRPADDQMSIHTPSRISAPDAARTEVVVNVYAGSERSVVEMRVDHAPWTRMERVARPDPYYMAIKESEESETPPNGRKLPRVAISSHLWAARLPANLPPGPHMIHVRTKDMFEQTWHGRRIIRVEPAATEPAAK